MQFYYNNSDVQLLLNLLASGSGLAGPLRSLALIDREFNSACLPELVVRIMNSLPYSYEYSHFIELPWC